VDSTLHLVKGQNENLRQDIVTMGNEQRHLKDEEQYRTDFNAIGGTIDIWAARQTAAEKVTKGTWKVVRGNLKRMCDSGQIDWIPLFDDKNKKNFEARYQHGGSRVELVRHYVASVLFKYVFEPFIFGLEESVSDSLGAIGDEVFKHRLFPHLQI
jgi:hypothetical protein